MRSFGRLGYIIYSPESETLVFVGARGLAAALAHQKNRLRKIERGNVVHPQMIAAGMSRIDFGRRLLISAAISLLMFSVSAGFDPASEVERQTLLGSGMCIPYR
jgi:hypothetical protein